MSKVNKNSDEYIFWATLLYKTKSDKIYLDKILVG